MIDKLKKYLNDHPISGLLVIALIPRLVAVLFSKGYGMHDDHFLIIEAAQSWVNGYDYNDWLPKDPLTSGATGHSWFYVGMHYFYFEFMELIGFSDPQGKMYLIRLGHALYSLLMIPPVYFIVKKAAHHKVALQAGLLMALLWSFPILSVRNLVEMVCIPPVLWATWILYKNENYPIKNVIYAGLLCGFAMAFRFHIILFIGGFGLVLLGQKKIIGGAVFGVAAFVALFLTQLGDLVIWGRPFVELQEYIAYNLSNTTSYFNRPWYQYFGTIGGLMLPPLSLLLMLGYFKSFKKHLLLFLPSFVFFAFHCYFPNKQERFILPVIPFVIALGCVGWNEITEKNKQKWIRNLNKFSWRFFWAVNTIALLIVSPAYSKKSRVDAMEYLGQLPDYNGFVVEYTIEYDAPLMPRYYANNWSSIYYLTKETNEEEYGRNIHALNDAERPRYALFFENTKLEARKRKFEHLFNSKLEGLTQIEPSYLDKLLHAMNPNNSNETAYIYKINYQ